MSNNNNSSQSHISLWLRLRRTPMQPSIMNKDLPHQLLQSQSNPPSQMKMIRIRGSTPTFPHKLYMMLESAESLCLHHVVSWLPDGRSFQIVDPEEFMDLVLPHFFKATKFRSFIRQLNLWDFERMPTMRDNHWYHKSFIRGRPEILSGIIRTKIKGKVNVARHKQPPSPPLCLEERHSNSNSSFDIDSEAKLSVSEAKGSVCNMMSDGKYIASTSTASSLMTFSDIDIEFDDKMKEIFSTYERSIPLQVESERKVFLVGSCNDNLNEVLSTSRIAMKETRYDYDYVKEGKSKSQMVSRNSNNWDSLANDIEPLSISTVNELGIELDSHDDFQNFLRGLIN